MGIIAISFILMLGFLLLKLPVFLALLVGPLVYFIFFADVPSVMIAQRVLSGVESTPLLAIPFFVCAGILMNHSGVAHKLLHLCSLLMRRVPGGLAQASILLSVVMGGLSGSNLADAAMQSEMVVPEMEKQGFSKPFSTVLTAFSSLITPLIPPGIAIIIFGAVANVSIGRLLIAGLGIAILLTIVLVILVIIIAKRRNYESIAPQVEKGDLLRAFKHAILPLCLPVLIIGGIRFGVITPTEAGAIAVMYVLMLGLLYRELKWRHILKALKGTVMTTSSIMLIIGAASTYSWVLTRERVPQAASEWMLATIQSPWMFLLVINIFLLVLGMFIEGNAATIVLVPILLPIARAYGIDDIHFAMIFTFNKAISAITPPMGTLMFITCGITGCKIKDFLREAIPWYLTGLIVLAIITIFPIISLGLVNLTF